MPILLFPGLRGSDDAHWQRHWAKDMPDARVVEQRNWARPNVDLWVDVAARAVRKHPNSLLIGHSLGAVLIAHLGRRHPDLPVAGAMLVAPADTEAEQLHEAEVGLFGEMPRAALPFPSMVVASRNDPYMSFAKAGYYAALWRAQLYDLGRAGHINIESGYGPWPEGRALLQEMLSRSKQNYRGASPMSWAAMPFDRWAFAASA